MKRFQRPFTFSHRHTLQPTTMTTTTTTTKRENTSESSNHEHNHDKVTRTNSISSLRASVRQTLQNLVAASADEHTAEDWLRAVQTEAHLLLETERVRNAIRINPMQDSFEDKEQCRIPIKQVERLNALLEVTDCQRIHTLSGYVLIQATVVIRADAPMKQKGKVNSQVTLKFRYERDGWPEVDEENDDQNDDNDAEACDNDHKQALSPSQQQHEQQQQHQPHQKRPPPPQSGARINYLVELSRDYDQPSDMLMWCTVFAAGSTPSHLPAQNISQDFADDGWEDMSESEDEDDDHEQEAKRARREKESFDEKGKTAKKLGNRVPRSKPKDSVPEEMISDDVRKNELEQDNNVMENMQEDQCDKFYAGIDPDALSAFLEWTQLELEDLAAFCLLFSFPFFEHEWDIPGYILDACMGSDSANDEDE